MKRRTFLAWTGLSLGVAASTPPLLRRVLPGEVHPHEADPASELARARSLGKPLLVLVDPAAVDPDRRGEASECPLDFAPSDEECTAAAQARWTRQPVFGAWLRHSPPETLALLALCHLTSARLEPLRRVVDVDVPAGEVPWLVLVESDEERARALPGAPPSHRVADVEREPDEEFSVYAKRRAAVEEQAMLATLAVLTDGLASLLDSRPQAERAAQVAATLGPKRTEALLGGLRDGGTLDDALAFRAGALALERAPQQRLAEVSAAQAAEASRVWTDNAPRGAHWARSGGCGTSTVCALPGKAPRGGVGGCGMGRVPALSRDFLAFFVRHA